MRLRPRFMLAVHGGAGAFWREQLSPEEECANLEALESALRRGHDMLGRGSSSLDAVQAAIQVLEDSPCFNAGRGAALTSEGTTELDAAIMDGYTLATGAVVGVQRVKNPIVLARLAMERTPHGLVAGACGDAFARSEGMAQVPNYYSLPQRRWNRLQQVRAGQAIACGRYGTVGAVALDAWGHLAAGTSTGGVTNGRPRRIGDSALIGTGTYANGHRAVSATGARDCFIRNTVAFDICARPEHLGTSLAAAADEVVMWRLVAQGGEGGVIALDREGNVAMPFNTEGMFRGRIGPDGRAEVELYG